MSITKCPNVTPSPSHRLRTSNTTSFITGSSLHDPCINFINISLCPIRSKRTSKLMKTKRINNDGIIRLSGYIQCVACVRGAIFRSSRIRLWWLVCSGKRNTTSSTLTRRVKINRYFICSCGGIYQNPNRGIVLAIVGWSSLGHGNTIVCNTSSGFGEAPHSYYQYQIRPSAGVIPIPRVWCSCRMRACVINC